MQNYCAFTAEIGGCFFFFFLHIRTSDVLEFLKKSSFGETEPIVVYFKPLMSWKREIRKEKIADNPEKDSEVRQPETRPHNAHL